MEEKKGGRGTVEGGHRGAGGGGEGEEKEEKEKKKKTTNWLKNAHLYIEL